MNFVLNFAPPIGTNLTVVRLTGYGTLTGTFANLPENQMVSLSYSGQTYYFVANYNAGPGSTISCCNGRGRARCRGAKTSTGRPATG